MGMFFGVGVVSTACDWIIYSILINFIAPSLSVTVSFVAGAVINFLLNRKMTFGVDDKKWIRFLIFCLIAVTSWAMSVYILSGIIDIFDLTGAIWLIVARVFTTCVIFVYNYNMHRLVTFR
jgi:putative flippase GtrA